MAPRAFYLLPLLLLAACDDDGSAATMPSTTASVRVEAPPPSLLPPPPTAVPVASGPAPSFPKPPPLEAVDAAPKEVTFAFAPRPGTKVTVEQVRKKQKARGTAVGMQETIRTVTNVEISEADDGFRWHQEPGSFSVHGQPTSRIDELMASFPFTYRLDEGGKLLGVDGFDDITTKAKGMLGPMALRRAGTMLAPETARRTKAEEWNGRVGDLVGKTLTLDEPYAGQAKLPVGKGDIQSYSVIQVGPWTNCALGTCIKITTDYDSDPEALSQRTGVKVEPVEHDEHDGHEGHDHGGPPMGGPPGAVAARKAPKVGFRNHVVRIVDPTTGMPVWERIDREIDLRAMGKLREETVVAYTYEKPVEKKPPAPDE